MSGGIVMIVIIALVTAACARETTISIMIATGVGTVLVSGTIVIVIIIKKLATA